MEMKKGNERSEKRKTAGKRGEEMEVEDCGISIEIRVVVDGLVG